MVKLRFERVSKDSPQLSITEKEEKVETIWEVQIYDASYTLEIRQWKHKAKVIPHYVSFVPPLLTPSPYIRCDVRKESVASDSRKNVTKHQRPTRVGCHRQRL